MNTLTKEQVDDLLDNVIQVTKRNYWKGDKVQFTCPIHHESNPSCGININYNPPDEPNKQYQVFHCFACHAGGSIPWLLFKSLPEQFKNVASAISFLTERYGVNYDYDYDPSTDTIIKRYEESLPVETRAIMPTIRLASLKSGKETYSYFTDRGFDKEDIKKFMIGRDLESETVTIPVFYEDNQLAGIIGRYIDPNRPSNSRYKVYNFERSNIIFPLNHLVVSHDTIIGVESMLDVIMMHKWGYTNAVAFMGSSISKKQAKMITDRCRTFIALFDNDESGRVAQKLADKLFSGSINVLYPTYYPENGKDPIEWGREETEKIIDSSRLKDAIIPRFDD